MMKMIDEDESNQAEGPNQDQEQSIGEVARGLDNIMQPPNEEVVFESETTDERVEFNQAPAGEAPALRRSTRESKPTDIWTYSHAQATKMAKHIHTCFLQTYSLNAGLKEFGQEGYDAAYKEIGQLHGRGGLTPTGLRDLTDEEAKRALEAVTILLRKKSGVVKSRTCANGSVQCKTG